MTEPKHLASPPGYGPIALLDRGRHAGLGLRPDRDYAWSRTLNITFLTAGELARAALDFPIAFVPDSAAGELVPVAIFGLRAHENLFVDDAGQWRALAYIPAYVRRYPFCIAEAASSPGGETQRLICVQEDQLVPSHTPLFDMQGEATPAWKPVLDLIEIAEAARQQTLLLVRTLDALGLIVPFEPLTLPNGGGQLRLDGLHRIDESRFDALTADQLMSLRGGGLSAIYAHFFSLGNFSKLLQLAVARQAVAAA